MSQCNSSLQLPWIESPLLDLPIIAPIHEGAIITGVLLSQLLVVFKSADLSLPDDVRRWIGFLNVFDAEFVPD
jgi:hypothetical protein